VRCRLEPTYRQVPTGSPSDSLRLPGNPMSDWQDSSKFTLLAERIYIETTHRKVAIRVVRDGARTQVRFYKYRRLDSDSEWKVDLARFSISDIDFCRIASDAIELARQFTIPLDWPSLKQLQSVDFSVQTLPECPECHGDQVVAANSVTKWCCQQCEHEWESKGA
jgi:hypothetical protein